jgi:hypothetical protein
MAGRGVAVATSRTSGSTKTFEDRVMARNSYTQRNRKPVPVAVNKWFSARSVFRHQASIRSTGMRSLRSWKTIRVITGTIICGNGSGEGRHVVSFFTFVAQYAAVIGRQFSYELLQAVSQVDEVLLQHELGRLVEAEIVSHRGVPPPCPCLLLVHGRL